MCDITLNQPPTGTLENFTSDYSDCQGNTGSVQLERIAQTTKNGVYAVTGTATDGSQIDEEVLVPNSEQINPTKVFQWVAKKLKEVLCPTCV